jgi:hypothetical protein
LAVRRRAQPRLRKDSFRELMLRNRLKQQGILRQMGKDKRLLTLASRLLNAIAACGG